ncbi:hypothetical protein [Tahibacter amnicola]|uniref:Uncharacterized protein n=1 Tax=Tahibacter amnicola TaxID=2976241 RepID=A0ABY6B7L1_9GAMM|nr:hypothetical protein [Tahibacter amnicola]UXI65989.1 hypothetical protein N4264_14620 [Tahibacter amnicola]
MVERVIPMPKERPHQHCLERQKQARRATGAPRPDFWHVFDLFFATRPIGAEAGHGSWVAGDIVRVASVIGQAIAPRSPTAGTGERIAR